MADPVYEYTKGKGWQVTKKYDHPVIHIEHSNKRYVLEHRKPITGEWYLKLYGPLTDLTALANILKSNELRPHQYYCWDGDGDGHDTTQILVYTELL
jgi:hypothetical protein